MAEDAKRIIKYLVKREPILGEGRYFFRSVQNIEVREGEKIKGQDRIEEQFPFEVSFRRFRLKPEEIHSVYPPAMSGSEYENHIPQLTLMEDAIPWEQELELTADGRTGKLPGMFLLVLKKEEGAVKHSLLPKRWLPGTDEDIYLGEKLTNICRDDREEQEEICLDVPAGLLLDLLPDVSDLPYMAHVRWVEVEDKETRHFVTEGHYSSLIANRAIRKGHDTAYEVFVISTLGLEEFYRGKCKDFNNKKKVRLSCLYSWEFTALQSKKSDFKTVFDGLDEGYLGNKMEMTEEIRRLPLLEPLLRSGWRPFNTVLRDGSRTAAWYKTPLSPVELPAADREESVYSACLSHADAGMAFLIKLGMYDATVSAAWTLGRLLALKNQPYLTALFELRLRHHAMEKQQRNINLIREVIQEDSETGTEQRHLETEQTDFESLLEPVRESCSRMLREAASQEAASEEAADQAAANQEAAEQEGQR